jgi:hypothetical protein
VFQSAKDARKALTDIARAHQLCLKTAGLEDGAGSCFAYQVGKCKGACVGKEPLMLHDMRLQMALSSLKFKAWPFPGASRCERGPDGGEYHVLDHWAYLGTARRGGAGRARRARGRRRAPSMSTSIAFWCAISRNTPKLDWQDLRARRSPAPMCARERQRALLDRDGAGGRGLGAGRGTGAVRRRRHSRAQPRREVSGHARGGLPRLPVVAHRDARAAEPGLDRCESSKNLFEAVKRIDWREHLAPGATLACDCSGGNESIRHTIYGSQLLKDAVCDNCATPRASGPNIKPERPDVLLHLHVEGPTALVSVDFSGESLHRRGYRTRAAARR